MVTELKKNNKKINLKKEKDSIKVSPIFTYIKLFQVWQTHNSLRYYKEVIEHKGITLTIKSFDFLNGNDKKMFLAILSLCTHQNIGKVIENDAETESIKKIRSGIFMLTDNDKDIFDPIIYIRCKAENIYTAAGYKKGGDTYSSLCNYLDRLAGVVFFVDENGSRYSMKMLDYQTDKDTGELIISINSKSAAAILSSHFTYVNMSDLRQIKDSLSILVYSYLSSCIWQHTKGKKILLDNICRKVFNDFDNYSESTKKVYRSKVRTFLKSMNNFYGWTVSIKKQHKDNIKTNKKVEYVIIDRE
ncbi:replication protein C, IncQ-type [Endozoicomonas euniceicola]|uniref:Replication protein C, IncQ-type n=1 Tax=Endozoicomonas euniceicola TaxID=1234143 RepID=A0ABY6H0J8_9GAMM|nr:replication protein C, IncQ-type [Endozoicomonas euniceicola]UYM18584.1 replication protein C, IncQ-type [Endozoicomonas euniceicola]